MLNIFRHVTRGNPVGVPTVLREVIGDVSDVGGDGIRRIKRSIRDNVWANVRPSISCDVGSIRGELRVSISFVGRSDVRSKGRIALEYVRARLT